MDTRDDIGHIRLSGITAIGHHGVLDSEKQNGQPFVVDVDLSVPLETRSDQLSDTVNYAVLAQGVVEEIQGEPVDLIETLAGRIADRCLAAAGTTPSVGQAVEVTVHKPHAPVGVTLSDVAIVIRRNRTCQ
ncbi:dihydroneopterin aldolase [Acidipropionibacterium jensenii]|uniref:7,8-dihydroneopterin aldolase n=1 Tax=Acidipropionibacterium jensenii TaxID=1749 RepID=A0A448P0W0_9ACTN|nr:dihydroneopterin aldolase [Acidipropionibacterium jensenii]MDN5977330.1 dihydroneopterin aldolase [Acidipropionibacterium jensenii]MDN5997384.1 dihydroneopterin aldolase [Acidipropionibacterium jensenii]MDN6020794.1 dihydroneopterin aldolase [Acidipropionibacterium jensenii]MDN6426670.1 dihydroneopterin aldolase [Acidipropionibacterium jensenii]MDN6441246.1 dihydroneopterin aldolase [Acidipropionibacterium jensenii]